MGEDIVGIILMLIISLVVFFIFYALLSIKWAILISVVFFILWFIINVRAAKTGLIISNLLSFITARISGANHKNAINWMVYSRYKYRPSDYECILDTIRISGEECKDLHKVIYAMHLLEAKGIPPPDWTRDFHRKIDVIYNRFKINFDSLRLRDKKNIVPLESEETILPIKASKKVNPKRIDATPKTSLHSSKSAKNESDNRLRRQKSKQLQIKSRKTIKSRPRPN